MARGKTLLSLLRSLRAELGVSQNAAHNSSSQDTHIALLQSRQEELWEDYDWPHLRVRRIEPVAAGQRYYDFSSHIPIDRIEKISYRWGEDWCELAYGIEDRHYEVWDSDLDERSEPVERWRIDENDQVEIWPLAATDGDAATLEGYLKIEGIRALRPLVNDDDTADLDDRLIVLMTAAKLKAASGAKDAALTLSAAMKRKQDLIGNVSKIKKFSLKGSSETKPHQPYIPRVHYRDRET